MSKNLVLRSAVLIITLIGFAPLSHAQDFPLPCFDPIVVPNPARADQQIRFETTCSCLTRLESPTVERQGQEIRISYLAHAICGVPPPPSQLRVPLPSLEPGTYQVIHQPIFEKLLLPFEAQEVELVVDPAPLTIRSVPLGGWTNTLLLALLMLIALGQLRRVSQID
jgi:hypothetical protein